MRTRVFCPADSRPLARSRISAEIELVRQLLDARLHVWHTIEPPEHGEVFAHREPCRQRDVGTLEIHPPQHFVTLARHVVAEHQRATGGRDHQAHDHRDGRGLAGAVAAQQTNGPAAGHDEAYVIDRPLRAVFLAQKIRRDGGRYLDLADVKRRQSLGRDRRRIACRHRASQCCSSDRSAHSPMVSNVPLWRALRSSRRNVAKPQAR